MPATTVYWMNVSLDLKIDDGRGQNGGGDWLRIGEPLHREFNARARELALSAEGRVVYEIMEEYWPNAAVNETESNVEREYGQIWLDTEKFLVSRTRDSAEHATVIGGDDAIDQIARLRAERTGRIGVGGANLATQLLAAGLLDEVMLFTHPVILGGGRDLFDGLNEPVELDLIEQAQFEQGVTMHRYSVRAAAR